MGLALPSQLRKQLLGARRLAPPLLGHENGLTPRRCCERRVLRRILFGHILRLVSLCERRRELAHVRLRLVEALAQLGEPQLRPLYRRVGSGRLLASGLLGLLEERDLERLEPRHVLGQLSHPILTLAEDAP